MKTLLLFITSLLIMSFTVKHGEVSGSGAATGSKLKIYCPPPPAFAETIAKDNNAAGIENNNIDQDWYSKVIENIKKEEYNITFSDELEEYQSPNRANNIRFIYHQNGFTAKTRDNKIPLFDINDKMIEEFKGTMTQEFEMTYLGMMKFFLGLKVR